MPSPCVGRPFGLMANATGGMPFANYPAPLRMRRSARPINPLRGGPGWIGEPTKKPARREPCGLFLWAHRRPGEALNLSYRRTATSVQGCHDSYASSLNRYGERYLKIRTCTTLFL